MSLGICVINSALQAGRALLGAFVGTFQGLDFTFLLQRSFHVKPLSVIHGFRLRYLDSRHAYLLSVT